ncbi:Golgi-to-ER vesicle coat component, partial [Tulasnella sp. 332]
PNLSLYTTSAFLILDTDGNRVLAKYYNNKNSSGESETGCRSLTTLKDQRAYEKALWEKTKKAGGDIILYDTYLAVYRHSLDLIFYILGPPVENELMLNAALVAYFDALSILLRNQVEKRSVLDNLDIVLLCLDETIDDGVIVETDSTAIASRVSRPRADTTDIVINEETIMNAYQTIRDCLRTGFQYGKSRPIICRKEQLLQLGYLLQDNIPTFDAAFLNDLDRPWTPPLSR